MIFNAQAVSYLSKKVHTFKLSRFAKVIWRKSNSILITVLLLDMHVSGKETSRSNQSPGTDEMGDRTVTLEVVRCARAQWEDMPRFFSTPLYQIFQIDTRMGVMGLGKLRPSTSYFARADST